MTCGPCRLLRDARGATAVEFAFVAPVFFAFLFLLLDGGRMLFTKQALDELASAAARCAALKPAGCADAAAVRSWTASRGFNRSQLAVTGAMVSVEQPATCNSMANMAKVTIEMPYQSGSTTLLSQASASSTLIASACFPVT